ncbi:YdcF family protein [Candidatus Woesearchaeota archaeon]|nr:YdcF family protein [Candidatus Woesearchaeota archaeon]
MGYDAILIPGGGVRPIGEVPEWTKRRLDKAIDIYDEEIVICLSKGTTHKPPVLDYRGNPIMESVAAANYLIRRRIPKENIFREEESMDTIGNAYFARAFFTEPKKLKKVCIITSEFHMPRTKAIFEWVYSLKPLPVKHKLTFLTVDDEGIDENLMAAKKEKEKESLKQFEETKERIKNFKQLREWLFSEHAAYTSDLEPEKVTDESL